MKPGISTGRLPASTDGSHNCFQPSGPVHSAASGLDFSRSTARLRARFASSGSQKAAASTLSRYMNRPTAPMPRIPGPMNPTRTTGIGSQAKAMTSDCPAGRPCVRSQPAEQPQRRQKEPGELTNLFSGRKGDRYFSCHYHETNVPHRRPNHGTAGICATATAVQKPSRTE